MALDFDGGFFSHLEMVRQALAALPVCRKLTWISLSILAVIVATSAAEVVLNRWNKLFYDALENRDFDAVLHQKRIFAVIAGFLLVFNVG